MARPRDSRDRTSLTSTELSAAAIVVPPIALPRSARRDRSRRVGGGHERGRAVEHRVEQQLVGRASLRAEIDLAPHRHHVALADAERDDVRLIAEEVLAEQPAALEDLALPRIARHDL